MFRTDMTQVGPGPERVRTSLLYSRIGSTKNQTLTCVQPLEEGYVYT